MQKMQDHFSALQDSNTRHPWRNAKIRIGSFGDGQMPSKPTEHLASLEGFLGNGLK